MIHENFKFNPLKSGVTPQYELSGANKEIQQLIAKLQLGDYIEGTLLEKENSMVLKLPNGISFPIQLVNPVEIGTHARYTFYSIRPCRLIEHNNCICQY